MESPPRENHEDNRPIAVRRKRRASSALGSPRKCFSSDKQNSQLNIKDVKTPTKCRKRVRFSDPFPETSSTTGITPMIMRTNFESTPKDAAPSTPRRGRPPLSRRVSMPALPNEASHSSPLNSPDIEVQFAPLRQILTPRKRRQLKRIHLSEEINAIESEMKSDFKQRREIQRLKEELTAIKNEAREQKPASEEKFDELEVEIVRLRDELEARQSTGPQTHVGIVRDGDDVQLISATTNSFSEGLTDADFLLLVEPAEAAPPLPPTPTRTKSAAVQTSFQYSQAKVLDAHIRTQTAHLVQARLDLEYICPGETTVGLETSNGNCAPVLEALLDRLRAMKAQIQASRSALHNAQTCESNLRTQFNASLRSLDLLRAQNASMTSNADVDFNATADLEEKISELERSLAEKDASKAKLSSALTKYAGEVKDLESLITTLEDSHSRVIHDLNAQHDEAVADLECVVAAETRGRREAESESESRMFRIRELENVQRELRSAMTEKQAFVRSLEGELEKEKDEHGREIGVMNVRLTKLIDEIETERIEVDKLQREREWLSTSLKKERNEGLKVLKNMGEGMKEWIDRCQKVGSDFVEGIERREKEEVGVHKGLLTPVDKVSFRDVGTESCDGLVVIKRGAEGKRAARRQADSGIGMLPEDDEEEEEEEDEIAI